MTHSGDIQSCLIFDREQLREAVSILLSTLESSESSMSIAFGGSNATLSTDSSSHELPASGHWESTVFLSTAWLRAMNKAMPDSNPIELSVRDGRLHTGSYSVVCTAIPPRRFPSKSGIGELEFRTRVGAAAEALEPFLVSGSKLEEMVLSIEETRSSAWTPQESKVIHGLVDAGEVPANARRVAADGGGDS